MREVGIAAEMRGLASDLSAIAASGAWSVHARDGMAGRRRLDFAASSGSSGRGDGGSLRRPAHASVGRSAESTAEERRTDERDARLRGAKRRLGRGVGMARPPAKSDKSGGKSGKSSKGGGGGGNGWGGGRHPGGKDWWGGGSGREDDWWGSHDEDSPTHSPHPTYSPAPSGEYDDDDDEDYGQRDYTVVDVTDDEYEKLMADIGATPYVDVEEDDGGDYVIVDLDEEQYGKMVRYGGGGGSGRYGGSTKGERDDSEDGSTGSPSPTAVHDQSSGKWHGDEHDGEEECYDVSSVYHEPSWTEDGRRRLVHHVVYRPAPGGSPRGGKSDKAGKASGYGPGRDAFDHRNDPGWRNSHPMARDPPRGEPPKVQDSMAMPQVGGTPGNLGGSDGDSDESARAQDSSKEWWSAGGKSSKAADWWSRPPPPPSAHVEPEPSWWDGSKSAKAKSPSKSAKKHPPPPPPGSKSAKKGKSSESGQICIASGSNYCGFTHDDASTRCGIECNSSLDCPSKQYCYGGVVTCDGAGYCGTDEEDAGSRCGTMCDDDSQCDEGESCFGGITTCDEGERYCGTDRENAASECGTTCETAADCPDGAMCFGGITTCEDGERYCGTDRDDAGSSCSAKCEDDSDCPAGTGCFGGITTCPDAVGGGYCGTDLDDAGDRCLIRCESDSGCPDDQQCYGGVTACGEEDGYQGYCDADYESAAEECKRPCEVTEDCPLLMFCYAAEECQGDSDDRAPQQQPAPVPEETDPPTGCRDGCLDCDPDAPLACPRSDMKAVCDKQNDTLYPPGDPRAGSRVANFFDCYDMCKPSFCCIHDSLDEVHSPSCSATAANCELYYPCYVIWWKLSDTIGPATYLRVEQDEPFYDGLDFEFLREDFEEDEVFFQQLFAHHFDGEVPITDDTFENEANWT